LGKPYGIKLRCYWERLREQLGNLGTSKKHDENMLGTHYEQGREKKLKKNCPHLTPKRKNKAHHGCMLSLRIDCMKFLFPKLFITILGPNTRERERERERELRGRVDDDDPLTLFREVKTAEVGAP